MKKITFTFIVVFSSIIVLAQQVHWAVKLDTVTSQYSSYKNSGYEILGVPNVDPNGRRSPYAWAVEPNELDKEAVDWAMIQVDFGGKFKTNQIAVFESFNPGAISLIFVNDGTSSDWIMVYADTSVIRKTGLPDLPGVDKKLFEIAGKRKRFALKFWTLKQYFKPKGHYRILNVFFDSTLTVQKARIVINPFAVDGWNQIDAVAISDSYKPITYPKPKLADQSLIIEPKAYNLGPKINSPENELAPVVYPSGKFLFFARNEYLKDKHIYTQSIWFAPLITREKQCCIPELQHIKEKYKTWGEAKKFSDAFYSDINQDIIPHTVVGFSGDGQFMYLTNIFETKNDKIEQIFSKQILGLSVSHLDTLKFKLTTKDKFNFIDTLDFNPDFLFVNSDENILIGIKFDTIKKQNFATLLFKKGKNSWSKPLSLGPINKQNFYLQLKLQDKAKLYWLYIDSLSGANFEVALLKWSTPKPVNIQNLNSKSPFVSFYISDKEKIMLLSLERDDSYGKRDLYISFYDTITNSWTEPRNLGPKINSLADETAPFLDGDGRTLFFSSNGFPGYGGFDIFVAYRQSDNWFDWSEPRNLGPRINTGGDELNFTIDYNTRRAYYTSTYRTIDCQLENDIFTILMAKPITLNFEGYVYACKPQLIIDTCNGNQDTIKNYINVANALISFEAIDNEGKIFGDRKISFYTDQNGYFNVSIQRFINANKFSTTFAYKVLYSSPQTDQNCNQIDYIPIKINPKDYVININQNLYVDLPIYFTSVKYKICPPKGEIVKKEEQKQLEEEQKKAEEERKKYEPQVPTEVTGRIYIEKFTGCPYIYHKGRLYLLIIAGPGQPARLQLMEPNFSQYFDYNEIEFNTNSPTFKNMLATLENMLTTTTPTDTITVYIVASASFVPTRTYYSNFELARLRAENTQKAIINYLKNKNLDTGRVYFDKRYQVAGPPYQGDYENVDKYKRYQYVKVWLYTCSQLMQKEMRKEEE